jgi:hypothetical protein
MVDFADTHGRCLKGHGDVTEFFSITLGAIGWMIHFFSNPIIEVNGDTATGSWLIYAMSTLRTNLNAAPMIHYGRYRDTYVRTTKGWLQSQQRFIDETRASPEPSSA